MINYEAFFKVTYGLFIVSSGNMEKGNGFISNSVFQVTSEPPQFAVCCNKDNLTASVIKNTGAYSISILTKETKPETIGRFGYKSGKDINKLEGIDIKEGETGVPVVLEDTMAMIECQLEQTFDVGTHLIFIGKVVGSEIIKEGAEPMTYNYFREVRKGFAPKNAPTYIDKSKIKK
jgi:flavin reductase (DIM6/NTAB) family NADH-FMN oxidoreductase RutF